MKSTFKIIVVFTLLSSSTMVEAQNYPEMIAVTGGTFTMGDEHGLGGDKEQPTHEVTLSDFSIGKTEVTVGQYKTYCTATGVKMPNKPSWGWNTNDPIVAVNWQDAVNYCDWLSEKLDENIMLPTEAQWEYAARGGSQSKGYKYSGDGSIATVGWYDSNSEDKVHAVASKKANELGIYDMTGNIWEWCLDWYDGSYYKTSPTKNPKNTARGYYRVLRGGGFLYLASSCYVFTRNGTKPDGRNSRDNDFGFRVVSN